MSKLELYWSDINETGRAKMKAFDPAGIPASILDNTEPIFTATIKPDAPSDGSRDKIKGLLEKIIGRLADSPLGSPDEGDKGEETFKGVPRKILDEAISRSKAGEDVAGIILDKETGEYRFLTQAESDKVAEKGNVDTIVMDEDCDCPTCQARRAGEKAHPRKWN